MNSQCYTYVNSSCTVGDFYFVTWGIFAVVLFFTSVLDVTLSQLTAPPPHPHWGKQCSLFKHNKTPSLNHFLSCFTVLVYINRLVYFLSFGTQGADLHCTIRCSERENTGQWSKPVEMMTYPIFISKLVLFYCLDSSARGHVCMWCGGEGHQLSTCLEEAKEEPVHAALYECLHNEGWVILMHSDAHCQLSL